MNKTASIRSVEDVRIGLQRHDQELLQFPTRFGCIHSAKTALGRGFVECGGRMKWRRRFGYEGPGAGRAKAVSPHSMNCGVTEYLLPGRTCASISPINLTSHPRLLSVSRSSWNEQKTEKRRRIDEGVDGELVDESLCSCRCGAPPP